MRLITKSLKIVFCLFVGYEENQAQELAVDAARGRHARQKKSHTPVKILGSRPGIMWTCIVSVTTIASIMSEGEGIQ